MVDAQQSQVPKEELADYAQKMLGRIGIPVVTVVDSHVIKPSAINAFARSMHNTIMELEVSERLKSYLRNAVANGFLNTHQLRHGPLADDLSGLYPGGLAFFLPNTVGELKEDTARIAEYLKDAGQNYKSDSPPDRPEAYERAPTSIYLSKVLRGLFEAFNAALKEEGLELIERPYRQSARSVAGGESRKITEAAPS